MVKVLFVCLGNICRSPTAEGVFHKVVSDAGLENCIHMDSAGTGTWHVGCPPDRRAIAYARKRGIDISDLRARQVKSTDFNCFDYVLAMDQENYTDLATICPRDRIDRLFLFLDFALDAEQCEVPDPYYGGEKGFEQVFDLVEQAAYGLLVDIKKKHLCENA